MFYVHSLLSTWVFHCSIWISQENICGHICFGTNEEEKYESLPWTRFIKNWRLIAHFVQFQVLSRAVSLSSVESKSACVSTWVRWSDLTPFWSETELCKVTLTGRLQAHFKQWVPPNIKGQGMFFLFICHLQITDWIKKCLLHLLWVPCWTAVVYKKYNSHQNTH